MLWVNLHLLWLLQNLMTALIHCHKSSIKPAEKMRGRRSNFSPEKGKGVIRNAGGGGGGVNVFERREGLKRGFMILA